MQNANKKFNATMWCLVPKYLNCGSIIIEIAAPHFVQNVLEIGLHCNVLQSAAAPRIQKKQEELEKQIK